MPSSISLVFGFVVALTCFASGCGGFKPSPEIKLFDGKSLDGWVSRGGKATYKVEDNMIVGTTTEGSPNTFLCTTRDFADFELQLELRCDPALNSGIQFRSHVKPTGHVYGYQCETVTRDKCASGNVYDEGRLGKFFDDLKKRPGACEAFKDGQWNHYRVVAQKDRIRTWVNGVACADFKDSSDASGFIGLQVHSIKAGTGPYQVRWKNIRLRELAPDEIVK